MLSVCFCLQKNSKRDPKHESEKRFDKDEAKLRNRDAMDAFVAKLFATVSAVKAAYAELQMAQFPYNGNAIQSADEAVVCELKALSELKQSFLKKHINSSPPHITMLLAEIQEQQGLTKMYEITMKKMQCEIEARESEISSLQIELDETTSNNKSLETKLNSSGSFSVLDTVKPSDSNPERFHHNAAVNAIEPEVIFPKPNQRCFAFESFVCREMFDGFNHFNFSLPNASSRQSENPRFLSIDRFKRLKSVNPIYFLKENPHSSFGRFIRTKYLRLIHPKMELSFSGNLNQRDLISSGEYPESAFFAAFAEMAKRVWLLQCLAFSFDREVNIFQAAEEL
ncbi:hypothetical protein F0562_013942 [Nyssa sinensis]|uniref:DUF641 domain-containing protein n=1 Tax=Nyssa sinensis TaxID=561372 RepID=A0A5J4ZL94_9ASTE|nr:hypothetical protein F0562_013942 [Nyssa sinensis]